MNPSISRITQLKMIVSNIRFTSPLPFCHPSKHVIDEHSEENDQCHERNDLVVREEQNRSKDVLLHDDNLTSTFWFSVGATLMLIPNLEQILSLALRDHDHGLWFTYRRITG